MTNSDLPATEPSRALPRAVPPWVYALALLGVGIGLVSFLLGAAAPDPGPAWRALLINFLFWTSLAQGALMWAVIFRITRTTWSAAINRLGHSAVWFLGFSVLIFAALFLGRRFYPPWAGMDLGDRSVWLNARAVFARDGAGLVLLLLLGMAYVRVYRRQDSPAEIGGREGTQRRLSVLALLLAAVYVVTSTLIGFDLVMALVPDWYSTLFGWYYSLGGLYAGIAALIVMAVLLRRWLGVEISAQQFQDLGNLLMAFAMAMTYFFFAQALTIWYENLPPETVFALPRVHLQPWRTLSWVLIAGCYLGPFALLVVREMKENPRTLSAVALLVLAAMWLERYLLVAPSLAPRATAFPPLLPLIGVGFLGLFVLTAAPFLARCSISNPLDLALVEEREAWR